MILGGMGPIGELPNEGAKWFASCYALYSGIALLGTVAVLLAPVVHRMLHALHLEDERRFVIASCNNSSLFEKD